MKLLLSLSILSVRRKTCRWSRVLMLATVTLSACAVGPDFVAPGAPEIDRYLKGPLLHGTESGDGRRQYFSSQTELQADWWHLFKSAALDQTVAEALHNNPSLQAADASLRQSQNLLLAGGGIFFPSVNLGVAGQRGRNSPYQDGTRNSGTVFNLVTASATISYPLDLFGGERRTVEGLAAQVEQQGFMLKAAYLTLSANVVNTSIARAAYAAQIDTTEQLIDLEKEQLRSIEILVRNGVQPYANILSQQSLIAANEAQLSPLVQKMNQADHLLALLKGSTSSQTDLPEITLDSLQLPVDLPLSLPSDLVRQRPDVRAAEALLHVASANIGVATAAMFPSLNLSATYGKAGASLSSLFGAGSAFWSVGPALTIPVFEGGRLRYQRDAAKEAYQVQLANYRISVLTAFEQVADVLTGLQQDARALQAQADARAAAAAALTLLQVSYRAGMSDYLSVLAADVQWHTASIAYLQTVAQRHQDTVALFVALGGGWWNGGSIAAQDGPP